MDGTEIGEIITRGNITMLGYYKAPEATATAFAGGYFHTGDLAVRFADGSFAIQGSSIFSILNSICLSLASWILTVSSADRAKDIIISGGGQSYFPISIFPSLFPCSAFLTPPTSSNREHQLTLSRRPTLDSSGRVGGSGRRPS